MTYELRTLDGKYKRALNDQDFKAILSMALRNGWRPSPKHIHAGSLRLNETFSEEDGKSLAAALERGLQQNMPSLSPEIVVAIFESIAVLRRGASQFIHPLG